MKKNRYLAVGLGLVLTLVVATAVSALTYRVRWGDTLSALARRFGTTVSALVQANNISNPDLIYAGQLLEVPGDETPTPGPTAVPTTPPATPIPPTPGPGTTYVVRPGDTLSAIARRFGTTVTAIAQANNIRNVNFIYVGQVLRIPGGSEPVPTPVTPPPPTPEPAPGFALGGQSNNLANQERMRYAGMRWVKIQHKWEPGDSPDLLRVFIEDAHSHDFKILISVTGAEAYPAPNSIDFPAFVDFVAGVAALDADAIEIWNEMNIDFEWPAGQINPTAYVNQMLAPAYNAIKGIDSSVLVISGAPAPTGFDNGTNAWADDRYLAGMRAAGAGNYADCIGVHHNAGATSPNVSFGHPGGNHYSWYFQPTLNLYYNTFGGREKLCLTELGYLSPEGFDMLPANFGWASDTSVAEQAQWLAEAVSYAANSGRVQLLIVYNVDFNKYTATDPQAGYAIIRPDGECPACDTLHNVTGGG